MRLAFPDLSGEDFRDMWSRRESDRKLIQAAGEANSLILFVHADRIAQPRWVIDEAWEKEQLGLLRVSQAEPQEWTPELSPTQV